MHMEQTGGEPRSTVRASRNGSPWGDDVLRAGPLEIRAGEHTALAQGTSLTLTVRELQLLLALARRTERVVSRDELHAVVWGAPLRPTDRSVDVYVSKLRRKLEEALPAWRYIHTHFGLGYRFSPRPLHDFHRSLTQR
jgi:DNA-binding response OmpR family regulator